MIAVGTTLQLDQLDTDHSNTKYRAKVIDVDESFIFIDYPIEDTTNKTVFFPLETAFEVTFFAEDRFIYAFKTMVSAREKRTVPALKIPWPNQQSIHRVQRRQYVRVETAVDVAVQTKTEPARSFSSVTLDISGGGLSLLLKHDLLNEGETIIISIELPFSFNQTTYIEACAEIVRISSQNNIKSASMRFNDISDKDRQTIVSYCFEKQREARRKELS